MFCTFPETLNDIGSLYGLMFVLPAAKAQQLKDARAKAAEERAVDRRRRAVYGGGGRDSVDLEMMDDVYGVGLAGHSGMSQVSNGYQNSRAYLTMDDDLLSEQEKFGAL